MLHRNIGAYILFLSLLVLIESSVLAENITSESLSLDNKSHYHLSQSANHRFEFNNDIFNGSDNGISNAISFQLHSKVFKNWLDVPKFSVFKDSLGAWLLDYAAEGLHKRISTSVSQLLQTPTEITKRSPIANDVAYLGMLTITTGFIAYNDDDFKGFNIVLGLTGEPSFAEQSQNIVHEVGGAADVAEGWDHQVDIAPILNLGLMYKKKFLKIGDPSIISFDASLSGEAKVGNMITEAGVRLETRFGYNLPAGFAPIPDPVGRFMQYDARLLPQNPKVGSIYATASAHATVVSHLILTDGTIFRSNPDVAGSLVKKEPIVGFVFLGLHYERPKWAIHFQQVNTSDFVKVNTIAETSDPENTFTSISFEWKL